MPTSSQARSQRQQRQQQPEPVIAIVSATSVLIAVLSLVLKLVMSEAECCCERLVQMKARLEGQQQEMDEGWKQQRQLLQAQEQDAATWKADTQHQLNLQQVCLISSLVSSLCRGMALSLTCVSAERLLPCAHSI